MTWYEKLMLAAMLRTVGDEEIEREGVVTFAANAESRAMMAGLQAWCIEQTMDDEYDLGDVDQFEVDRERLTSYLYELYLKDIGASYSDLPEVW